MPSFLFNPETDLIEIPCDLCGSNAVTTVMYKKGVLFQHAFRIVRCNRCGFVFVNPRLRDELIPLLYDDEYYRGAGFDRNVDYFLPSSTQLNAFHRDVVDMLAEVLGGLSGRRCVDIGCGNGLLAVQLRESGCEAYGTDSSIHAKEIAAANRAVLLDNPAEMVGQFDAVTAIEVIEHVSRPGHFLDFVLALLKPGGIAFISTGNWNVHRRVSGTPYVMPEGHLQYFTPQTMRGYFKKVGFEEAGGFINRDWAGWRFTKRIPSSAVRVVLARTLERSLRYCVPGFLPMPIGRKPL